MNLQRRKPRVLWLFRHRTARYEEVRSLLRAGAEVVPIAGAPKGFPNAVELPEDDDPWTPPWREVCSVPEQALRIVREHDYFSGRRLPLAVLEVLNSWFDAIVVGTYSHLAYELLCGFDGHVLLRPYGGYPYTQRIGPPLVRTRRLNRVARSGRYHWLPAIPYQSLLEDPRLSRNETFWPGTVSQERLGATWAAHDSDPVVTEVISLIRTYRSSVYADFLTRYGSLPVRIFGQNSPGGERGDDSRIVGTLPDDAYYAGIARCRAMIYQGIGSKYHLHYHAVEALAMGVPVVFFERSALAHMALYDGYSARELSSLGMVRTPGEALERARGLVKCSSAAVELSIVQRPLRDLFAPERADAIIRPLLAGIARDQCYRRSYRDPMDVSRRPILPRAIRRLSRFFAGG